MGKGYKVLTYVQYRAVSGVFQNIDPPPPLHPANVSSPRTIGGGGGTHLPGGEGGWVVNILEDARHWIGLLQYNPSTGRGIVYFPMVFTTCLPGNWREGRGDRSVYICLSLEYNPFKSK